MRGEYLDLLRRLSTGEVYHLERVANAEQREEDLRSKKDQFLDLYLEWKKTGTIVLKDQIEKLVNEIRAMDPDFRYEVPD